MLERASTVDECTVGVFDESLDTALDRSPLPLKPTDADNDDYASQLLSDIDIRAIHSSLAQCQRLLYLPSGGGSAVDIEELVQSLIQSHRRALSLNQSLSSLIDTHSATTIKLSDVSADHRALTGKYKQCEAARRTMEDQLFLLGMSLDSSMPLVTMHHDEDESDDIIADIHKPAEESKEMDVSIGLFRPVTFRGFESDESDDDDSTIVSPINASSPTRTPIKQSSMDSTPMKMSPWTPANYDSGSVNDSNVNASVSMSDNDSLNLSTESAVLSLDQQFANLSAMIAAHTRDAHHHTIIDSTIQHLTQQYHTLSIIVADIRSRLLNDSGSGGDAYDDCDTENLSSLLIGISGHVNYIQMSLSSLLASHLNDSLSQSPSPAMLPEVLLQASKIESMLEELQQAEDTIAEHESSHSVIRSLIKQLTVAMNDIQSDAQLLQSEMKEALTANNSNSAVSADEVSALRVELADSRFTIDAQRAELAALRAHQSSIEHETRAIEKELSILKQSHHDRETRYREMEARAEKAEHQLADTSSIIDTRVNDILQSITAQEVSLCVSLESAKRRESELQAQIATLQREVFELSTAIQANEQQQNRTIDQLKSEHSVALSDSERSIASVSQSALNDLNIAVSQLKSSLASKESDLTALRDELLAAQSTVTGQQSIIDVLTQERAQLATSVSSLKQATDNLTAELAETANAVTELRAANHALPQPVLTHPEASTFVDEPSDSTTTTESELVEARTQLLQSQTTVTELQSTIDALTQQHSELDTSIVSLKQASERLTIELAETEAVVSQLRAANESLSKSGSNSSDAVREVSAQLAAVEQVRDQLTSEMAAAKAFYNMQLQAKNDAYHALKQQLESLELQYQSMVAESAQHQNRVVELEAQIASLAQERAELDECVASLRHSTETLSAELAETEASVSQLRASSEAIQQSDAIRDLTSSKATIEAERDQLVAEVSALRVSQEAQLHSQSETMESLTARHSERVSELEARIKLLNKERDELADNYERLESQHEEATEAKDALTEEIDVLKLKLASLNDSGNDSVDSEHRLSEVESSIVQLTQERDELTASIVSLHEQSGQQLAAINAELTAARQSLAEAIAEYQIKLATVENTVTLLEAERKDKATEIHELKVLSAEQQRSMTETDSQWQSRVQKLESEIAARTQERSELDAQMTSLKQATEKMTAELAETETAVNQLRAANESLQQSESSHRTHSITQLAAAESAKAAIEQERDQLMSDIKSLKNVHNEQLQTKQQEFEALLAKQQLVAIKAAATITEHASRVTKLELRIQSLTEERDALQAELRSVRESSLLLRRELESLLSQSDRLQSQLAALQSKHEAELLSASNSSASLQHELESLTVELARAEAAAAESELNVEQHQAQLAELESQVQSLAEERDALQHQMDAAIDEQKNSHQSLTSQLQSQQEHHNIILAEAEATNQQLQSLTNERDELRTEIHAMQIKHDDELRTASDAYEALSVSFAVTNSTAASSADSMVAQYQERIAVLESQVQSLTTEHSKLATELQSSNDRCQSLTHELDASIKQITAIRIESETESKQTRDRFAKLESRIQSLTTERDELQSEVGSIASKHDSELRAATKSYQSLRREFDNHVDDAAIEIAALRRAKSSITELEARVQSLTNERDALTDDFEQLQSKHSKDIRAKQKLVEEFEDLKSELSAMKNRLLSVTDEHHHSHNEASRTIATLRDEADELTGSVTQLRAKVSQLTSELSESEQRVAQLRASNQTLTLAQTDSAKLVRERDGLRAELDDLHASHRRELRTKVMQLSASETSLQKMTQQLHQTEKAQSQLQSSLTELERENHRLVKQLDDRSGLSDDERSQYEWKLANRETDYRTQLKQSQSSYEVKLSSLQHTVEALQARHDRDHDELSRVVGGQRQPKDRIIIHTKLVPVAADSESDDDSHYHRLRHCRLSGLRRSDERSVSQLCALLDEQHEHVSLLQQENSRLTDELSTVKSERRQLLTECEEQRRRWATNGGSSGRTSHLSIAIKRRGDDWSRADRKHRN